MSARLLAGQKKTAQEIATQLDIPLEIAQIAVLNPIGDNIKVSIPDLSELNDDILFAGGKPGLSNAIIKILETLFPKAFPSAKSGSQPLRGFIFNKAIPNSLQQKNIERFTKKIPANAKNNVEIYRLPNGGIRVRATSPGKVPGSKAVYEKRMDKNGGTIGYTKTTYDPQGNIVHVKEKF